MNQILTSIDLVGIPVSMNLFGREKSKTRFGGLCSLMFFGFVAWAIYNCSKDLFSTLNPKIVSYDHYTDDPRALTLSHESFPMAFVMMMGGGYGVFKDESIFTLEILHTLAQYYNNPDGSRNQDPTWTVTKIHTESCTSDYFAGQGTSLTSFNLESAYCIAKEQPELDKLEIQGVYTSWTYQDITVRVLACDNSTSNNTCASPEEIDAYLSGSWFNAMYVNMVVNPQNYSHPNATFKEIYYTMISPSDYRETYIELGYVEVSTDRGWLTEERETKSYIKVNNIKEFLQTKPRPDGVLISTSFMVSQLETYYTRSYKKIQGVLAEVGSLSSAALVAIIILANPFLKLKFRESLMNELFDVQLLENHDKAHNRRESNQKQKQKQKRGAQENNNKGETNKLTSQGRKYTPKEANLQDYQALNTVQIKNQINSSESLFSEGFDPENKKRLSSFYPGTLSPIKTEKDNQEKREAEFNLKNLDLSEIQPSKPAEAKIDPDSNSKAHSNLAISVAKVRQMKSNLHHTDTEQRLIPNIELTRIDMKSNKDEGSLHIDLSDVDPEQEENRNDIKEEKKAQEEHQPDEKTPIGSEIKKTKGSIIAEQFSESKPYKQAKAPNNKATGKIDIGLWEYIRWFVCKPTKLKQKAETLDEGIKNVNERLEIANVLKKLREIDNLRALLFDSDQLLLFNSLPKPIIPPHQSTLQRPNGLSNSLLQNPKFIHERASQEEILRSLRNLNSKAKKTEIDKRFIEIFRNQAV